MKNWVLPIAVLGVSGLGLIFATDRGRTQFRVILDRVAKSKNSLGQFSKSMQKELELIQRTLDELSDALEV